MFYTKVIFIIDEGYAYLLITICCILKTEDSGREYDE